MCFASSTPQCRLSTETVSDILYRPLRHIRYVCRLHLATLVRRSMKKEYCDHAIMTGSQVLLQTLPRISPGLGGPFANVQVLCGVLVGCGTVQISALRAVDDQIGLTPASSRTPPSQLQRAQLNPIGAEARDLLWRSGIATYEYGLAPKSKETRTSNQASTGKGDWGERGGAKDG